jgi:hypothetical protein
LIGNKWFKDVPRLLAALKFVDAVPPGTLYEKYRPIQEEIVDEIARTLFSLDSSQIYPPPVEPSDALLLANLSDLKPNTEYYKDQLAPYHRGKGYRLCITPYFEEHEMNGDV